jgi:hypothetical protein
MNRNPFLIADCRLPISALALALAGCAQQRAVGVSPTIPSIPEVRQDAGRTLLHSIANRQSPIGNPLFFTFKYSTPLTNCYLESSPDLVHWTVRDDYWISTNADDTTYWSLRGDKSNPCEFYRIGGETIP